MERFRLKGRDRERLEGIVRSGQIKSRVYKRAKGLLALEAGGTLESIAKDLRVHRVTVAAWREGYKESKLEVLKDAPRSGRPRELDGIQRAKITALACTQSPDGHSQWSLRLLADKVVELGYCESISHTEIRRTLKKTNLNRTLKKHGVLGK